MKPFSFFGVYFDDFIGRFYGSKLNDGAVNDRLPECLMELKVYYYNRYFGERSEDFEMKRVKEERSSASFTSFLNPDSEKSI
ncbi:hypothetical protein [Salinicoccus sp. HZC-1]|uniref:hypothetical protein n=1 Tax=Salinicoccus sp. HZC-1 TaxID=3385497 RepID=UPI00398BACFE